VTDGTVLDWGRRYLMCPPVHFAVAYEINPWMHREVEVDTERAHEQWQRLVDTLDAAGATIELLPPERHVPDLVFTANAGLVSGKRFVPAHFRHPERQPETPIVTAWFREHGYAITALPSGVAHEGAGDALPFREVLLSGYRTRSDVRAATFLSSALPTPVRSIELVDPRLYHLDLTFCPLDDRHAICAPTGWDRYGRRVVSDLVPERIELDEDEALTFCANSVVIDRTVIMPSCPPRVGRQLEAWGFIAVECRVDEFLKAGGGCRCLTLALDVELSERAHTIHRVD
jgi:N-dimethylarginine dimethylaminohydrolase